MPEPWTFVEARGELVAGTARTLLEAAERAGLPRDVVHSVYGGFEVPERLLEHLNSPEEDEDGKSGAAPTQEQSDAPPADSAPRKAAPRKAAPRRRA